VKCEIANLRLPEYKCILFYPRRRINLVVKMVTGVLLCYSNTTAHLILFFPLVIFLCGTVFLDKGQKLMDFSVNKSINLK
jgi:hypothetical protein